MAKNKVENKKQMKPEFDRNDLTETNKFIKKCKKEIAFCTIKPVKTSKRDEMENQILFRGKKICQICFSKVAFFSQYRFEKNSRSIFKPTNQNWMKRLSGLLAEYRNWKMILKKDKLPKNKNQRKQKKTYQWAKNLVN